MTNRKVRVRFAPSPTGPLHIGGVRTALYNYLFAKKNNGDFILRIEDTDQARLVVGAENYIIESLKWLGITPNEGVGFGEGEFAPYRQSERKEMYHQFALKLVEEDRAYYAFDSSAELEAMRVRLTAAGKDPKYDAVSRNSMKNSLTLSQDDVTKKIADGEHFVIRLKLPEMETVDFSDMIRGPVSFNTAQLDDKILFKGDGMPTYHLANVVDDYLMKISHVIRGEEWLPSAPIHVLLYRYLGWESVMPQFAHLPLLLKPEGTGKLSKRDGDRLGFPVFPIEWKDPVSSEISSGYRESGYLPEAVINLLALLGWNPGTEEEIFSKEKLIETFSIERVGKHGAKFDQHKAKWFNQHYIRHLDNSLLIPELKKMIVQHQLIFSDEYINHAVSLIKQKISFIQELWSVGIYFFIAPEIYDETVIAKRWNEKSPEILKTLIKNFSAINEFTAAKTEGQFNASLTECEVPAKDFLQLFRVCLTGVAVGPSLFETTEVLGKNETIKRLNNALIKFAK
ncbi:MAG: glutamate--tRNA ligase [Bacteroidia bacterium]